MVRVEDKCNQFSKSKKFHKQIRKRKRKKYPPFHLGDNLLRFLLMIMRVTLDDP